MCLSTSAPRTQRGIVKVSDLHAVLFSHLLRGVFHALATVDEAVQEARQRIAGNVPPLLAIEALLSRIAVSQR